MASPQRGCFITFEGIDGSGKTTQLRLLAEHLRSSGLAVTEAREPGGTPVGDAIRRILLESATVHLEPVAEVLLYFASRAQNVRQVILPALDAGQVVLCDRYVDASTAYQGGGRRLGLEMIADLERIACAGLKPDLTFIIDIDPRTSVERALRRNRDASAAGAVDESRFEQEGLEFFSRVRAAYLDIAEREPERAIVIYGERAPGEVHREIRFQTERILAAVGRH